MIIYLCTTAFRDQISQHIRIVGNYLTMTLIIGSFAFMNLLLSWVPTVTTAPAGSHQTNLIQTDPAYSVFEGDIAGIDYQAVVGTGELKDVAKNGVDDEAIRWSNHTIPYLFSEIYEEGDRKRILDAMKGFDTTCVRFVPKTTELNFLQIAPGLGCSSLVGKRGGLQFVSLTPRCLQSPGIIQHELMHAIGFWHEQSRQDRDNFVDIRLENVITSERNQFEKYSNTTFFEQLYDFGSVMHYGEYDFSKDSEAQLWTIRPKSQYSDQKIGQRDWLSSTDIKKINLMYKCSPSTPTPTIEKPPAKAVITTNLDYSETWTNWFKLCDGINDTSNGWDEDPDVCVKMCVKLDSNSGSSLGLFNLPSTKRCMKKTYLCDGIQDSTTDLSENKSICQRFCKGGGYVAVAPSYQCIHFQYLCDGIQNTRDGSDEIRSNCDKHCQALAEVPNFKNAYFQLEPIGRCMMKTWLCDQIKTNEFDTTEEKPICRQYCKGGGYFNTDSTEQCIHWSKLCDGRVDTTDRWDEVSENCVKKCTNIQGFIGHLINLPKAGPRCMHKTYLCDGIQDSFEDISEKPEVCETLCRGNGYFQIPDSKQCIRVTSLCDGVMDTRNGWDEMPQNCLQYCKSGRHLDVRLERKTKRCVAV